MRRFKITQRHINTLLLIQDKLSQKQIADSLHETEPATSYRIKLLVREGYVVVKLRDAFKVLELTLKALTLLSQPDKKESANKLPNTTKSSLPAKRMNGMQVYYKPDRTEYAKLEAILAEANISYHKSKIRSYNQYTLNWKGYAIKFTTQHLIAYCPEAYSGFERKGLDFINMEVDKANRVIGELILKLKLKVREQNGFIWFRLAYFEIAHTGSTTAQAVTTKQSYKPLAYNLKTGECIAWADNSFNLHELEFNKTGIEAKVAGMLQDMEDGKWSHREDQKLIREVMAIQRENTVTIAKYARQIELHLKLMKKIDEKLSQKKLFE